MHFGSYGLRKLWLNKCLKSPVSEDPWKATWQMGQNTA